MNTMLSAKHQLMVYEIIYLRIAILSVFLQTFPWN